MKYLFRLTILALLFTSTNLFAADKTNILFIIGDDMGVDALNGFGVGERFPTTPNLDKLRNEGITFTNVWAAPVCAATRASLLTGKYGINNGVPSVPGILNTEQKSIFKEIKEQTNDEYKIAVVGKWHLSEQGNYNHPIEHGADNFMGVLGAGVKDYYKWLKYENGVADTCYEYATKYFTDYAINWINNQEKPWLMWLAHVAPHAPFQVPPEGTFSVKKPDIQRRKYKAMIESMDYEIGRLLDSIPDEVLENTTVVFIGDNGTPGNIITGFPDKRGKRTIYRGGINVPMIISGKGVSRVGEDEDALINISDVYATLAQLVNPEAIPAGEIHDSYSFKQLLSGDSLSNRTYNFMGLGANSTIPNDMFTARNNQFKLLDLGNKKFEFYDLTADPLEQNNLLPGELTTKQEEAFNELLDFMFETRGEDIPNDINTSTVSPSGVVNGYPIVHTGVSKFYGTNAEINDVEQSNVLFWQDAGRQNNTPSYTDNGDGTVSDNITGLMWEKDMGEKMTWDEAVEKAKTLNTGGYNEWRIPTIKELYSLILFTGRVMGAEAQTLFIDTNFFNQPIGNVDAGERTIDAQTWSLTHYTGLTMRADTTVFGVNFVDGRIKGYPKYNPRTAAANKMYFRMVRGNTDYGKNLFSDNGNSTVTDSATMLMWQKADDGVARDWLSSLNYCENLVLNDFDDWHLPHAKELQSIVDYNRSPMATNSAAIDTVFQVSEINDPDGNPGHYPYYWTSTTHLDGPNPYSGAAYVAFGEALGKMNNNLMDVHGAGAQRSDPKSGATEDYPAFHGPQGDVQMVYNHCRCVREVKNVSTYIDETQWNKTLIYPNPVNDKLSFIWPGDKLDALKIYIYNLNGEVLLSRSNNQTYNEIDVSHLVKGIYFVVLESENTRINRKIVKL